MVQHPSAPVNITLGQPLGSALDDPNENERGYPTFLLDLLSRHAPRHKKMPSRDVSDFLSTRRARPKRRKTAFIFSGSGLALQTGPQPSSKERKTAPADYPQGRDDHSAVVGVLNRAKTLLSAAAFYERNELCNSPAPRRRPSTQISISLPHLIPSPIIERMDLASLASLPDVTFFTVSALSNVIACHQDSDWAHPDQPEPAQAARQAGRRA